VKHQAINLVKFKAFQKRLKLPLGYAIGILESLWIFAQTQARDGDLTKFTALEIAGWIEYPGEPEQLIDALVECRWLDRIDDRILIHDWDEHKPNWLKGVEEKKAKKAIQPGVEPSTEPGTEPSCQPGMEPSSEPSTEPPKPKPKTLPKPNEKKQAKKGMAKGKSWKPEDFDLPEHMQTPEIRDLLSRWIQSRKQSGKPLTEAAIKQQSKDMAEWGLATSIEALENSIRGTYQGLFPPRSPPNQSQTSSKQAPTSSKRYQGD